MDKCHFVKVPLTTMRLIASGARESVAAHSLHRLDPTKRPATTPRRGAAGRNGKTRLLATRRGGLIPGTAENEQRYTTYQRLVHETDARQNEWNRSRRTLVLQGDGRRGTVGSLGLPYACFLTD